MALRTDATGEYLSLASAPARHAFTMTAWWQWSQDTGQSYGQGGIGWGQDASHYAGMTYWTSGAIYRNSYDNAAETSAGGACTVGNWYFITIQQDDTYNKGDMVEDGVAISLAQHDHWGTWTTPAYINIGYDANHNFHGNQRIAHVKVWNAVLSVAELENERYSVVPKRRTNLWAWWPLISTTKADALKDYSGNGRNLIENGTCAIEDGPPVPWGAPPLTAHGEAVVIPPDYGTPYAHEGVFPFSSVWRAARV
jgi:hypothetical protein